LSTTCDIRQTVVSTILAYLEMAGVLEACGSFFEGYRLKLMQPLRKVLAGRDPKEKRLLEGVFAELDAEWKWLTVRMGESADRLVIAPEKLRVLLEDLEAAGDVALKKSGWRQAYRMKKEPGDLTELARETAGGFKAREVSDLARLEQVLGLSSTRSCLTKVLLKHFGEKLEVPCGHCDRCRGVPPVRLKRKKSRKVTDEELRRIRALHDEKLAALGTERQLARFLCGMSSPASMRARLYRHDDYGMLADLPFEEARVLAGCLF
jgi:ATP-dependent DNA helicase RecQ